MPILFLASNKRIGYIMMTDVDKHILLILYLLIISLKITPITMQNCLHVVLWPPKPHAFGLMIGSCQQVDRDNNIYYSGIVGNSRNSMPKLVCHALAQTFQ